MNPIFDETIRADSSVSLEIAPIRDICEAVYRSLVAPDDAVRFTVIPASRAVTRTAGVMVAPAVVLVGCTVKASCVAAPATMLKAPLACEEGPTVAAVSL